MDLSEIGCVLSFGVPDLHTTRMLPGLTTRRADAPRIVGNLAVPLVEQDTRSRRADLRALFGSQWLRF